MHDEVEKNMVIQDDRVAEELQHARRWRTERNEGRARVCARRAAGWAVGNYRRRLSDTDVDDDAYKHLAWLNDQMDADQGIREAAGRLCTKVGEDFTLPHHEDPLDDARMIIAGLQDPATFGERDA